MASTEGLDGWTDGRTDGRTDGQTDGRLAGWMDGWMDEQNHSERVTKQWKENVVCVYEEGRGGGIRT